MHNQTQSNFIESGRAQHKQAELESIRQQVTAAYPTQRHHTNWLRRYYYKLVIWYKVQRILYKNASPYSLYIANAPGK